jgi:hypothetical protein
VEEKVSVIQRKAVETNEEFGEAEQTLAEFFDAFIKRHAIKGHDEGVIALDVSAEECEILGRSFIKVMVGWAAGLIPSRARRGILPVSIRADNFDDLSNLERLEEDEDREEHIH